MKYKEFKKLAEKHLTILEGYEVDKKGNTKKQIYGLEKLHKAITVTHSCKSDSEQFICPNGCVQNVDLGSCYACVGK